MEGLGWWLAKVPGLLHLEGPLASIILQLPGARLAHRDTAEGAAVNPHPQPPQQQPQPPERRGLSWRRGRRRAPPSQFACQLCVHPAAEQAQCQELVTTGSKAWGLGPALPLARLYDFAIYLPPQQVAGSSLAAQYRTQLTAAPRQEGFYAALRNTAEREIDYSLVVRASRNLPIRLVAAEYRRILRGRLQQLGHSAEDAGLATMLEAFSEERLPASIKTGSSVKQGTTLLFTKRRNGELTAHADGLPIARVQSPALCAAIMDVYLGPKQPVSKKSRRAAGEALVRMIGGGPRGAGAQCSLENYVCKLRA